MLNPASGTGGERESEEGFNEAITRTGVAGADAAVVRHNRTVNSISALLDALLHKPEPPTALLVSRPVRVLTALGHLLRRGVRMPREVGLISRDDDSFLEHVVPSVARYSSDPAAFARKLSKTVWEVASGGAVITRDYRIIPRFVRGETVG